MTNAHPPVQPTESEQFIQEALRLANEMAVSYQDRYDGPLVEGQGAAALEAHLRGGKTVQPTLPDQVQAAVDEHAAQPMESVAQVHVDENGYITEDPWTDADIDNLLEALEREPGDEQFATDAITVIRQLRAHPPAQPAVTEPEVEAMCECVDNNASAGNIPQWFAEDVNALLRKQAAQIDHLVRLNKSTLETADAQIERVESANSSLHAQWDSEVKTLHAQIANLTDRLEMDYRDAQIAELRRLLRACLDDEFGVGSKALIKEINAAIDKEGK